jgi:hypothetical protein
MLRINPQVVKYRTLTNKNCTELEVDLKVLEVHNHVQ